MDLLFYSESNFFGKVNVRKCYDYLFKQDAKYKESPYFLGHIVKLVVFVGGKRIVLSKLHTDKNHFVFGCIFYNSVYEKTADLHALYSFNYSIGYML